MKPKYPTESELEILQILWANEPASVRFINEELNKKREVGYTTTLKLMQIMLEKGLLTRTAEGRKHLYSSNIKKTETQTRLLDRFVEATFKGSAQRLMMQLLGNRKTSKADLEEIKDLIDKIENEKP